MPLSPKGVLRPKFFYGRKNYVSSYFMRHLTISNYNEIYFNSFKPLCMIELGKLASIKYGHLVEENRILKTNSNQFQQFLEFVFGEKIPNTRNPEEIKMEQLQEPAKFANINIIDEH
jgi:hypothetical protein